MSIPTISKIMMKKALNSWMDEAEGGITKRQALIIYLMYYADLDGREVADLLGVTEGSVSKTHKKGIEQLRTILNGEAPH